MYEDEFELTFQVPEEESAPEPLAAPAAKPAAPVEPVADEPTRIMTLGKTAAPAVDEPTRVITLEKPAEPPAVELPEAPAPEPVKERPAPAAPAAARRVLISGGDRGIGAAAARAFAAAGYQVAVLYHQNAAAAAALEQQLPGCIAIQCDVASRASCELAFHAVEQAMGRVDVLVCNAGIAQQKLFTDITPEEWQRMLDVNLSGAFHLCQLALPGMIRRKQGRILTKAVREKLNEYPNITVEDGVTVCDILTENGRAQGVLAAVDGHAQEPGAGVGVVAERLVVQRVLEEGLLEDVLGVRGGQVDEAGAPHRVGVGAHGTLYVRRVAHVTSPCSPPSCYQQRCAPLPCRPPAPPPRPEWWPASHPRSAHVPSSRLSHTPSPSAST